MSYFILLLVWVFLGRDTKKGFGNKPRRRRMNGRYR